MMMPAMMVREIERLEKEGRRMDRHPPVKKEKKSQEAEEVRVPRESPAVEGGGRRNERNLQRKPHLNLNQL
jgi:hypothetical protein